VTSSGAPTGANLRRGLEALPIGGFTGTISSPTPSQVKTDISAGQFHLVLAATSTDPRLRWITAQCRRLGRRTSANLHVYFCLPGDAG